MGRNEEGFVRQLLLGMTAVVAFVLYMTIAILVADKLVDPIIKRLDEIEQNKKNKQ